MNLGRDQEPPQRTKYTDNPPPLERVPVVMDKELPHDQPLEYWAQADLLIERGGIQRRLESVILALKDPSKAPAAFRNVPPATLEKQRDVLSHSFQMVTAALAPDIVPLVLEVDKIDIKLNELADHYDKINLSERLKGVSDDELLRQINELGSERAKLTKQLPHREIKSPPNEEYIQSSS